jgi:integrase
VENVMLPTEVLQTSPAGALSEQALQLLDAGVPAGTRRAYGRDRADWAFYAHLIGADPLPVDPALLVEYVSTLLTAGNPRLGVGGRPLSPAGVSRRLSAISTWSREQGHGAPDLRPARLVLRGQQRLAAARPQQAAPLSVGALRTLLVAAGSTPDGPDSDRALRDQALLSLGFALGARRSELVAVRIEHIRVQADGIVVQVHRAKTRDLPDLVAVPWAADASVCAGRAVIRLRTRLAAGGFTDGPLFRQIRRGGHVQPEGLAPQAVADILQRIADRAELPVPDGYREAFSAHSLRRGFATEARRAGADSLRIARHGGWADNSASLATYLADVDRWDGHPLTGVL